MSKLDAKIVEDLYLSLFMRRTKYGFLTMWQKQGEQAAKLGDIATEKSAIVHVIATSQEIDDLDETILDQIADLLKKHNQEALNDQQTKRINRQAKSGARSRKTTAS